MLNRGRPVTASRVTVEKVVNPKSTFFDDALNFVQPDFTRVIVFERTARHKAKVIHGKDNGLKYRLIASVERAIDEDVVTSNARGHGEGEDRT